MANRARVRGSALLVVLAIGMILTATAWSGLAILATEGEVARDQARADEASELAEAGLQWAIAQLERDRSFQGTEARALGGGHFDVRVEELPGKPQARRVHVVGRVAAPHALRVSVAFTGLVERAETPNGPVWRRLTWRSASR